MLWVTIKLKKKCRASEKKSFLPASKNERQAKLTVNAVKKYIIHWKSQTMVLRGNLSKE